MGLTLRQKAAIVAMAGLGWVGGVSAQTNSWLGGSGGWQATNLWSLDQTPSSNQDIVVTNTGTFTVTIDDNTASNFPGTLSISNLSASGSAGASTLLLTNRPASTIPVLLTIANNAVIGTGSVLNAVDTSAGQLGVTVQASSFTINGSVLCQGNAGLQVGGGGLNVGAQSGAQGVWQIAGGTNTVGGSGIQIGPSFGDMGTVWMTSGFLQTSGDTLLGNSGGIGSLTVSNGTLRTQNLKAGEGPESAGTVTIAGGTVAAAMEIDLAGSGRGFLWLTGGELDATDSPSSVISLPDDNAEGGFDSAMVCSGGVLRASNVQIAEIVAEQSRWTIAGGTSIVGTVSLDRDFNEDPLLLVSSGLLQTPQLDLNGGAMTVSGGVVQVNYAIEVCGTSGTVVIAGGELDASGSGGGVIGYDTGNGHAGQVIVSSGTLTASAMSLGSSIGSVGTLTVAGGTASVTGNYFFVGDAYACTGVVAVTGGTLLTSQIYAGGDSVGILTISNGTMGIAPYDTTIYVGEYSSGTGIVQYVGGNLYVDTIFLGEAGFGSLLVSSNVSFTAIGLLVGNQAGSVASATIQGGSLFGSPTREIYGLEIGVDAGSTGTVYVTNGALMAGRNGCGPGFVVSIGEAGSGRLSVTNSEVALYSPTVGAAGTLECINSQFTAYPSDSSNCGAVNNNVMFFLNSTGTFDSSLQNNATLVANGSTLTFEQPVDNSGWIIATNGALQFQSSVTNSGAVLLGPDQFRVTSVVVTGSDAAITWQAFCGNDYRVQASADPAAGFSDISTDIVAAGSGPVVTNFTDHGAVTNATRRFYRVRQIVPE